jgi:hypothetical protein
VRFRRKPAPVVDPDEANEYHERAKAVAARAEELIARERRIIRENHLGPRIHQRLKESRP